MMLIAAILLGAAPLGAQPSVGAVAPDLRLRVLGGGDFQLAALRGRPVVLTFWGTWCPPCRVEFPELVAAYHQHHAAGLEIVGVNQLDQEGDEKDVKRFTDAFAVPFVIALDTRGRSRRDYHLVGLPTTVFINREGVVTRAVAGPLGRNQLAEGLASIGIEP